MDVETFLKETRRSVVNLITRELQNLDAAKDQTTAWIQFKVEVEGEDESIIKVVEVREAFNSWIMEVFQGSDLGKIITHMKTQVENPALANSRFAFDRVLFLGVNFHHFSLI